MEIKVLHHETISAGFELRGLVCLWEFARIPSVVSPRVLSSVVGLLSRTLPEFLHPLPFLVQ